MGDLGAREADERALVAPAAFDLRPPGGVPVPRTDALLAIRPAAARGGSLAARFARSRKAWIAATDLEIGRGALFLLAPVGLCTGSVVYFTTPFEPGWLPLAAWGVLAAVVWTVMRSRPAAAFLAAAVFVACLGALAAKVETVRHGTKMLGGEITTRLTGEVEFVEPRESGRVRLTIRVLDTARPKLRYQPDRVRVTARKVPAGAGPGTVIEGLVRLSPPMGPLRPDSYDFSFESYFDGIGANGFFLRDPVVAASVAARPGMFARMSYAVEDARNALADRIRGHIGGEAGEIAAALIAGVRAGIPEEANEALRITGLAHVLSISGLHMALVAGVVIASLRFGFALFPNFSSRHATRKFAAGAALIVLAVYLLVSGMAVAAQRSFLMLAVMLVALLFDHAALTMRNLAISAIVILLVAPHEAVGPSFQMSFAATAALVAAYGWWSQRRAESRTDLTFRRHSRFRTMATTVALYAGGLVATSLIAGAATGIFGAWHFQRASPLGLVANLATMPIVSLIVMPSAVFGVLLMPLGLDGPVFVLMGAGIDWMMAAARWLAARTPIDAIGAIPPLAVVLLSLALVPLTLATTSPWRLAAVPLLAGGLAVLAIRDLPHVFVSEDARLVALRTSGGAMAVNRTRPNPFVTEDWQRAMLTNKVERPKEADAQSDLFADTGRFLCRDNLCAIRLPDGRAIAHAKDMPSAARACDQATVIIIEDPSAANPCPFSETRVLTANRFALEGSAELVFDAGAPFVMHSAIGEPTRPWHDHRRFSREARGLAPYQPKKPAANAAKRDASASAEAASREAADEIAPSAGTPAKP